MNDQTTKAAIHSVSAVPSYEEIIERNKIECLLSPGDLTLRNGDIAVTKWGDLMLNNEDYSAFFKLVQEWRYNYPTLKVMFEAVFDSVDHQKQLDDAVQAIFPRPTAQHLHPLFNPAADYEKFHRAVDQHGSAELARGTYAGAITMVVTRLLHSFRGDIVATDDEWATTSPMFSGYSIGRVLEASANNFRHNDEWARSRPLTQLQLNSIKVLAAVLKQPLLDRQHHHGFAREICPETLQLIAGGDFARLENAIFTFANGLLKCRQSRLPTQNGGTQADR